MSIVVHHVPADGPLLRTEADATDLLGSTYGTGAEMIAIPVGRLDPDFFDLSTKVAGLFTQKLLNYRMRVAIVGDITPYLARSTALRDYVLESNRGRQLWFVADDRELSDRSGGAA
ncbi:DUF4180 domain-containing protein [Jongsikchunia kroppenstedtii]|uniref:DUF4180 domain-containing protein n=1 Tax=Jongsikchunia kroppenstedtii TaxID=1121721 RepID=UPI00037E9EC0|nr:DUF4180 domain-containing protein [Jongsikchunia kroppenstedtii]